MVAQVDTKIFSSLVLQLVNQALHLASFVEIEKSSAGFNVHPPPEKLRDRIVKILVKVGFWEMIFTGMTKLLFVFPETISATGTDPGEYQ
jgi:hypothetical protein